MKKSILALIKLFGINLSFGILLFYSSSHEVFWKGLPEAEDFTLGVKLILTALWLYLAATSLKSFSDRMLRLTIYLVNIALSSLLLLLLLQGAFDIEVYLRFLGLGYGGAAIVYLITRWDLKRRLQESEMSAKRSFQELAIHAFPDLLVIFLFFSLQAILGAYTEIRLPMGLLLLYPVAMSYIILKKRYPKANLTGLLVVIVIYNSLISLGLLISSLLVNYPIAAYQVVANSNVGVDVLSVTFSVQNIYYYFWNIWYLLGFTSLVTFIVIKHSYYLELIKRFFKLLKLH